MQANSIPDQQFPPTPPSELASHSADNMTSSTSSARNLAQVTTQHKHIWVITGPAGCGKTSVAEYLHSKFSLPYLEGDTFHPAANVEKMANDQPLTDADRWDWLITLRNESVKALANTSGVIVTCSALKRKYRDVMRIASYHKPEIRVHFVFLAASESALLDRVRARKNHYMKDSMVHSQFESLETPTEDEVDVLKVDASGNVEHVKNLALDVVHKVMVEDA